VNHPLAVHRGSIEARPRRVNRGRSETVCAAHRHATAVHRPPVVAYSAADNDRCRVFIRHRGGWITIGAGVAISIPRGRDWITIALTVSNRRGWITVALTVPNRRGWIAIALTVSNGRGWIAIAIPYRRAWIAVPGTVTIARIR